MQLTNAGLRAHLAPLQADPRALITREEVHAGVAVFVHVPGATEGRESETPLFLDFHGGGYFLGGGDLAALMTAQLAEGRAGVTWAPDYRLLPEHPYPAALDDAVGVYRAALEARSPEQIVVSGTSAGGNLAAAMLVRARDEGLPMPAGLVLLTPEADLTESGDSISANRRLDPTLGPLLPVNLRLAQGERLTHPYLSPLFADLRGFPPTLVQAGPRDLYLSNSVRMHRALLRAGVRAELHVWDAMPHGGFDGAAPEDQEVRDQVYDFERRVLRAPAANFSAAPRRESNT